MFIPSRAAQQEPPATITAAEDYCASAGLDPRLPERLIGDTEGNAYEPVSISAQAVQSPEDLAEQGSLLFRAEPVGGYEALLRKNSERIGHEALLRLHQRLAARSPGAELNRFLSDVMQTIHRMREGWSQEERELGRTYTTTQQSLRSWQDQTQQQPGLIRNMWSWVLGEGGRLSLPQVIWHWNERERLALRLHALRAAITMMGRLSDEMTQLLEQAATIHAAALRVHTLIEQRQANASSTHNRYAPWIWQSNVAMSAAQLSQQADLEGLLTQLFEALGAQNQAFDLEATTRVLAQQEAQRLLRNLSMPQLIELEAAAEPLEGIDPVILVGRVLLDQLQQSPTWRLTSGARPRSETVQITPTGEPLYRLDGLATAAYGTAVDRIGFLQVDLDVAPEELALIQSDDEGFRQLLERRNIFVLEELAAAWVPATAMTIGNNGDLLEEVPLG